MSRYNIKPLQLIRVYLGQYSANAFLHLSEKFSHIISNHPLFLFTHCLMITFVLPIYI